MVKIATALLSMFFLSCGQPNPSKPTLSFRDSVIREHFASIDSMDFYDTINYDYRVLKAYINDDTNFLKRMLDDIKTEKAQRKIYFPIDSFIRLKRISDLKADEVYRFRHSESFCFYSQFVTISRKGESIFLHYLEISYSPDGKVIEYQSKDGNKKIGPGCKVEKEFSGFLKTIDWELLERSLENADYWGLKPHNPRLGFDGSSWTIEGYNKQPRYGTEQQIHRVYRWSPINSFAELGKLFMKLAGEKGMCGSF